MRRNLFLVSYVDHRMAEGLAEVARHAEEAAPGIRARVIDDRRYRLHRLGWTLRPSLYFSPARILRFRPVRGAVLQGRAMPKSAQLAVLERAGIPVPRWTLLTETHAPDLGGFGPYVVLKPDHGRRGAGVRIVRRGRVRWRPRESPTVAGNTDQLVQEFVYTGRWPVCYRVTTLFGEPLVALRAEASHGKRPLEARYAFAEGGAGGGGITVRGNGPGSTWSLARDADLLALARRTHAAFPDIPVLGTDLVRDAATGKAYVLETNPGGMIWKFRGTMGESMKRDFGLDIEGQFDAFRVAGRILAEKTEALAR